MRKFLFLIFAIVAGFAQADGISGGAGGVFGASNILPQHTGINTTPNSNWGSGHSTLDIGTKLSIDAGTLGGMEWNTYSDNTNWYYKYGGYAAYLWFNSTGSLLFETSGSGSAGGVATPTTVLGIGHDGTLTSYKACTSNYTRDNPNYCRRTQTGVSLIGLTRDTCTAVAVPTGASVYADVYLKAVAGAANSAGGLRQTTVRAYSDSSCGTYTPETEVQSSSWEFTAVTASTVLSDVTQIVHAPVVAGSVYLEMVDDTGNNGAGYYAFAGYGD